MRRTINYTGRTKLPQNLIDIVIMEKSNEVQEFNIDIDLDEIDLPEHAQVFVEAYYRSSVMRFELGTVGDLHTPFMSKLDDIQSEIVYFRIKVVDQTEEYGRLISIADSISPGTDIERASLLPVNYRDLGNRIWRLELLSPNPVLEVNDQIKTDIAIGEIIRKDPSFLALVLPQVLREILTNILLIQEYLDLEEDTWQSQWLRFASLFPSEQSFNNLPGDPRRNESDYVNWIDDIVDSFCKYHDLKSKFETWLGEI